MKSSNREIRFSAFWQRSIVPSSLSSSSSSGRSKGSNGGSRVSLSDFLNRKLQRTSLPAGTVQRKVTPFSMLVEPRARPLPNDLQGEDKNGVQEEKKKGIDKVIFQQFKLTNKEKEDCTASHSLEGGGSLQVEEEVQESRKRRNPFQGENISGKHVVVLGKDLDRKPARTKGSLTTDKKPRPEYNHYENGGGFWDESMLSIDNEEVGCNEAWEGVGSTTLGGIEWH